MDLEADESRKGSNLFSHKKLRDSDIIHAALSNFAHMQRLTDCSEEMSGFWGKLLACFKTR